MNANKQQKCFAASKINPEALDALAGAIEECRAKPPYDYQRVILCLATDPDLAAEAARLCGAALAQRGFPTSPKRPSSVLVIDSACDPGLETLESIVSFVNRTRGVVVLPVTRRRFANWRRHWPSAADKIRRRTHLTIDFTQRHSDRSCDAR